MKQKQGLQVDTLPGVGVSKYPALLFNQDGSPLINKGKSSLKATIVKRYGEDAFFYYGNTAVTDKAVIIDGMPPLHLAPLMGMKTFKDWVSLMLKRKVLKFLKEADQVHLIFDCPDICGFNLKKKLQDERDSKSKDFPTLEGDISDSTPLPSTGKEWPNLLANRENKRKIITYVGKTILALKETMNDGKGIVIGGCTEDGKTYHVQKGANEPLPELKCNHEEADTRVFAHAKWTEKNVCQIVAADTDIFSILLLNYHHFEGKTMLLDQSDHGRVLHMNALVEAMNEDQDTDMIQLRQRNDISIRTFFALVHLLLGSDILCSPRGFGPAMVLKACIDFSAFLFSNEKGIQNLRLDDHDCKDAYCRFLLALYKKRYTNKIKMTPEEMFGTANIGDAVKTVREDVFIQTLENNSVIPSKECLELRALNLSFQLKIWSQATKPIMTVPDPTTHGWKDVDGTLEMIPDSKENQDKQASVYETVMKKCKCKKSQCKNGKCGCFNSKQNCSSFCECENCGNPHSTESKKKNDEDQLDSETDEEDASDEEGDDLMAEDDNDME